LILRKGKKGNEPLSGVGRELRGRDNGGNVNNVQYKSNQNCHYESPPYNEYIPMKILLKNTILIFKGKF
jgi:hypothetical protein